MIDFATNAGTRDRMGIRLPCEFTIFAIRNQLAGPRRLPTGPAADLRRTLYKNRDNPADITVLRRRAVFCYCTSATPRCANRLFEFFRFGRGAQPPIRAWVASLPRFLESAQCTFMVHCTSAYTDGLVRRSCRRHGEFDTSAMDANQGGREEFVRDLCSWCLLCRSGLLKNLSKTRAS